MSVRFLLWRLILRSAVLIGVQLLPLVTLVLRPIASFLFAPSCAFALSVSTPLPEGLLVCLTALYFPAFAGRLGCKSETKQIPQHFKKLELKRENAVMKSPTFAGCSSGRLCLLYGGEIKHLPELPQAETQRKMSKKSVCNLWFLL